MGVLNSNCSWSGQLPYRKRSGEMFMAFVTKSLLCVAGKLVGVITVSSDAAMFNRWNPENASTYQDHGRGRGPNIRNIQCHPPRPQIASSVSNLASRLLNRKQGNDLCSPCMERKNATSSSEDPSEKLNMAARVLARLHIRGTADHGNHLHETVKRNFQDDYSAGNDMMREKNPSRSSEEPTFHKCTFCSISEETSSSIHGYGTSKLMEEKYVAASSRSCNGKFKLAGGDDSTAGFEYQVNENDLVQDVQSAKVLELGDEVQNVEGKHQLGSGLGTRSQGSSDKGDNDLNAVMDCGVNWDDLQLGEEIGQGSFAVVYRGIWIGSDVAVKVYTGNQYRESIIEDYRKEIDIMKKLRHPNVLLFMGAVYSLERLAIVTEFMPRGSLFRTLHRSNQALDTKRRLKMALDVARGMNYLHCRNPPIVHRDLKSSNLLVDRNWTVKVGDFGLSKWKDATFLTTKSGGLGTPQWMAPEVLRNEPSKERSDVFSFGVILWELWTVAIPWSNLNSLQVVGAVGFMDQRLELPEGIDPQVASIIGDCWKSEPQDRPSFREIIHRMCSIVRKSGLASFRRSS